MFLYIWDLLFLNNTKYNIYYSSGAEACKTILAPSTIFFIFSPHLHPIPMKVCKCSPWLGGAEVIAISILHNIASSCSNHTSLCMHGLLTLDTPLDSTHPFFFSTHLETSLGWTSALISKNCHWELTLAPRYPPQALHRFIAHSLWMQYPTPLPLFLNIRPRAQLT